MNKRQRKKMFTRAFSKAYDESLEWKKEKERISITAFRSKKGKFFIVTSVVNQITFTQEWPGSLEEITIEGYTIERKKIGVEK